jgi:hypothetical protein
MAGCSLPTNCGLESSIPGYFAIKNQTNPFVPGFGFHRNAHSSLGKTRDFAASGKLARKAAPMSAS